MQLQCPSCQQQINETKTYDLDRNNIRQRILCPHCQMGLKVILSGKSNKRLTTKSLTLSIVVSVILQAISVLLDIAWLAITSHVVLIAVPMLLLLIDTVNKRKARIELKQERITHKV
ncbi:hypothetical protein [Catenovulum agarivorans]|uniref:hypothetical protein n=1 Tax=Catenovulum agarivorans TaxID=1172192 RepID=UPI000379A588|nr:hypothetical protein [Catenovulum agarivorans]